MIQDKLLIIRTISALRSTVCKWKSRGLRVSLIPTMGALHDGHMALISSALKMSDRIIVSVFVNPKQFSPQEDFLNYPRCESKDVELLQITGAHVLYSPTIKEMYPDGFVSIVTVDGPSKGLCGDFRKGHFSGVATVVTKLLLQSDADFAFFGEKDYQQLQIIRSLVSDLNIHVDIKCIPIVREIDGLAISSRNSYLTIDERIAAPTLYKILVSMSEKLTNGEKISDQIAWGKRQLLSAGFKAIDYLSVCDADSLTPINTIIHPARILVAAILGKTRLIDNVSVPLTL
ncbi:MAG: pantoate--beta-alanine ligase [Rhodospirillaceae bacterium]|jgi:pantoate--beta-alanine ligase|nr:pantoate--beta-alanine ligase [Rhodospirillaceae bacterium]